MTSSAKIYQKFLSLSRAVEAGLDSPLSPDEKCILRNLSQFWLDSEAITVVQAMNAIPEMSTSTVFRYLKKLRLNGYIDLQVDEVDNRVKYIVPTDKTQKYFASLGKLLTKLSLA